MKSKSIHSNWIDLINNNGPTFEQSGRHSDQNSEFVKSNYKYLKDNGFFSLMVPETLGGGGISHSDMCDLIRHLGYFCPSTALAVSMHQHLIATLRYKFEKGQGKSTMLEKVAAENLILISTGAGDWLNSSGELVSDAEGFRFTGKKHFCSQAPAGDLVVTSAKWHRDESGTQVLHFPVSMKADGVSIQENWEVMGMRGTGSHTINFENVFIPESSIVLSRDAGQFHIFWDVVLSVALPLIMSAYVGIAEKSFDLLKKSFDKPSAGNIQTSMLGKVYNHLLSIKTQWNQMVFMANDLDFSPNETHTINVLSFKTNITTELLKLLQDCMEGMGGRSFFISQSMEKLFRDGQAAEFHPLPKREQWEFTGERLIKNF